MLNPKLNIEELANEDYERYSRNIAIEEINTIGQKRLKSSRIIFIGAGGLNSPAMLYLTSCGIGTIGIIDDDIVETSNLQRQIIYNSTDINYSKVERAKITLKAMNPHTNLKIYNLKLSSENIHSIFYDYDIIIDGTDNLTIRKLISLYCYKLHKIHIYGAIEKFTGYVSVFNYQNGPNYLDIYNKAYYINLNVCNTVGVLNTAAGIVGIIQATEAIKIITGIGSILSGYLLKINPINLLCKKMKIKKPKIKLNPVIMNFAYKKKINKIQYIKPQEVQSFKHYKLIDIRSKEEFKHKHINHAINIPLNNLKKIEYINFIKNQFNQYILIIYCNNELRSLVGSQILNQHGIQNHILHQGIKVVKEREGFEPSLSIT